MPQSALCRGEPGSETPTPLSFGQAGVRALKFLLRVLTDQPISSSNVGDMSVLSRAAVLLAKHAQGIEEVERQERYATADPGYEDSKPVVNYKLTEGTRRCLRLLAALRAIANVDQSAVRAA